MKRRLLIVLLAAVALAPPALALTSGNHQTGQAGMGNAAQAETPEYLFHLNASEAALLTKMAALSTEPQVKRLSRQWQRQAVSVLRANTRPIDPREIRAIFNNAPQRLRASGYRGPLLQIVSSPAWPGLSDQLAKMAVLMIWAKHEGHTVAVQAQLEGFDPEHLYIGPRLPECSGFWGCVGQFFEESAVTAGEMFATAAACGPGEVASGGGDTPVCVVAATLLAHQVATDVQHALEMPGFVTDCSPAATQAETAEGETDWLTDFCTEDE